MNVVADLPDPLDPALALFEPRWIPRQVDVHLSAQPLQIQTLARRICRANEPYVSVLDRGLDLLARGRAAIGSTLNEGSGTTSVKRHRLVGKRGAQSFQHPFRRRTVLAENDGPIQF